MAAALRRHDEGAGTTNHVIAVMINQRFPRRSPVTAARRIDDQGVDGDAAEHGLATGLGK